MKLALNGSAQAMRPQNSKQPMSLPAQTPKSLMIHMVRASDWCWGMLHTFYNPYQSLRIIQCWSNHRGTGHGVQRVWSAWAAASLDPPFLVASCPVRSDVLCRLCSVRRKARSPVSVRVRTLRTSLRKKIGILGAGLMGASVSIAG